MKYLYALFFIFLALTPSVLGQNASFHKVFSGNGYDKALGVAQLPDSSYLITGSSSSFDEAPAQAFLLSLSKTGTYQWSKAYGGTEFEEGVRVLPVAGFGNYIIGTSSSGTSANFDAVVYFTDNAGNLLWEKYFDNGGWERISDALLLSDTSVIMVGETDATNSGNPDIYLMRIDKTGNINWSMQMGTPGLDRLTAIEKTSDSTFVVAGTMYNQDSLLNKAYVAHYHTNSSLDWEVNLGAKGAFTINDIVVSAADILVVGEGIQTGKTDFDAFRANISFAGTVNLTEEGYVPESVRYGQVVRYNSTAGPKHFVASQLINASYPTFATGEDAFIFRYDGNFYWNNYGVGYSGIGQDQFNHMINTLDGFAIAVGMHTFYGAGGSSAMVVKIGDDASFPPFLASPLVENLVNVNENNLDGTIAVYPNPFQEKLTITAQSFGNTVTVFGTLGEMKATYHFNEYLELNTEMWASGIYFLHFTNEKGTSLIKVVK
jgi:hypothetical protein